MMQLVVILRITAISYHVANASMLSDTCYRPSLPACEVLPGLGQVCRRAAHSLCTWCTWAGLCCCMKNL